MNRQCPDCGGYELDDGTCDLCYCDELRECANDCGEIVRYGGYCSTKCSIEHKGFEDIIEEMSK